MLVLCQPLLHSTIRSAEAPFLSYMILLCVDALSYITSIVDRLEDEARGNRPPAVTSSGVPLLPLLQNYAREMNTHLHGPFKSMCIPFLSFLTHCRHSFGLAFGS